MMKAIMVMCFPKPQRLNEPADRYIPQPFLPDILSFENCHQPLNIVNNISFFV